MDAIKAWMVGLLVLACVVAFAILITFNVKMETSIVISLDNEVQLYALAEGREPDTTFISVQDTPYASNIKILRVNTHFVWGGESNMRDQLTAWLDDLGITSYPEFPINYISDKERGK